MKRTFLIVALLVGVAVGLSVAIGLAWYFIRDRNTGPTAAPAATAETDSIEPAAGGAVPGNNNARAAKFVEHDTDGDGKLSLAEFSVGRKPAEAAKWFERRDANHDGFISREEFLPFSAAPKAP